MRAWVRKLRYELKTSIDDSLLTIGHPISKRDKIDAIHQVLHEKYNPFVMIIYGKVKPTYIYDVETLLYVQEAYLDKFHLELSTPSSTANVAQALSNNDVSRNEVYPCLY